MPCARSNWEIVPAAATKEVRDTVDRCRQHVGDRHVLFGARADDPVVGHPAHPGRTPSVKESIRRTGGGCQGKGALRSAKEWGS